jgi:hypothetical protein
MPLALTKASGAVESIVLHLLHPDKRSGQVARHVLHSVAGRPPLKWSYRRHAQAARMLLDAPLSDALGIEYSFVDYLYLKVLFLCVYLFSCLILPFVTVNGKYIKKCKQILRMKVSAALGKKVN